MISTIVASSRSPVQDSTSVAMMSARCSQGMAAKSGPIHAGDQPKQRVFVLGTAPARHGLDDHFDIERHKMALITRDAHDGTAQDRRIPCTAERT